MKIIPSIRLRLKKINHIHYSFEKFAFAVLRMRSGHDLFVFHRSRKIHNRYPWKILCGQYFTAVINFQPEGGWRYSFSLKTIFLIERSFFIFFFQRVHAPDRSPKIALLFDNTVYLIFVKK